LSLYFAIRFFVQIIQNHHVRLKFSWHEERVIRIIC
jgi:hypothetical protein